MSQRILVPYDESDPSKEALRYACEHYPDGDITVLHVIEIQSQEERYVPQAQEERVRAAEEVLEAAREEAGDAAVATESSFGVPDQAILDFAEESDFDLIVMGSHGRRGVSRRILGSVAERVVRHSPIPVLVTR